MEETVLVELKDFKNYFNEILKKLTYSISKIKENEKEQSLIRNMKIMINKIPLIPPTKDSVNSFFKTLKIIDEKNPNLFC